ncbi:hypothetical protein IQ266_09005 [filamentous cyanobacterium LEGE 11480]|uniref:Uncharacterized protein n=1 Tax=Romeriopsis navalis LEGE 11480 TaxID=2777977 RepID=A0A928Z1Z5_9CYAN|nr:hypothetical protein [Romeriopsis navalis]MBE9029866.1 hypothetical protein [Romeriopsis navalis LEGE 11480]
MFGTFQQSNIRIEIDATATQLQQCLTQTGKLQDWLKFQRFPAGLPDRLTPGVHFTSHSGFIIPIHQTVELVEEHRIRFLLSQGIDGFHAWAWGDGWVQSEIEGVSLLPIGIGQTASLMLLRQYVRSLE